MNLKVPGIGVEAQHYQISRDIGLLHSFEVIYETEFVVGIADLMGITADKFREMVMYAAERAAMKKSPHAHVMEVVWNGGSIIAGTHIRFNLSIEIGYDNREPHK